MATCPVGVTCRAEAGGAPVEPTLADEAGKDGPPDVCGGTMGAAVECARLTRKKLTICDVSGRRLPWPPMPAMTWNGAVAGMSLGVSGFSVGPVGVGSTEAGPSAALRDDKLGVPAAEGSKSE